MHQPVHKAVRPPLQSSHPRADQVGQRHHHGRLSPLLASAERSSRRRSPIQHQRSSRCYSSQRQAERQWTVRNKRRSAAFISAAVAWPSARQQQYHSVSTPSSQPVGARSRWLTASQEAEEAGNSGPRQLLHRSTSQHRKRQQRWLHLHRRSLPTGLIGCHSKWKYSSACQPANRHFQQPNQADSAGQPANRYL
jgi:hypothetical protein